MKRIKQRLILSVFVILSVFILAGHGWSQTSDLPHAFFNGLMVTYLDNPSGDDLIFMSTKINSVFYSNGSSSTTDSIVGKSVAIVGAQRNCPPATPCTTFTDATLSISDGTVTYFSATLTDIIFTTDGVQWFLNPGLDVNNTETLNLTNIQLNPNGSAYIQDLATALGSRTLAGMQMRLKKIVGNITGNSTNVILEGLLDGVQGNTPPVADAGVNTTISSWQISTTTINGTVLDPDGDALQCRWLEGTNVLQGWTPAGTNGECPLNLNALSLGTHTLTLEVSDTQATSSDDMILTIDNSAPHAAPGGAGVINYTVTLLGDVSDYDGDSLYYEWLEGTNVFCSGNIQSVALGYPVQLLPCVVSGLSLGMHTISLQVRDGINLPDRKDITVEIIDTSAPTISPVASAYIMWPPNHIMVDMAIAANAVDNSGFPVTLNATVTSNEPEDGLGDGDTGPYDWTQPIIDQNTGRIDLQLRRERSGSGTGRVYTVTITATDSSGNTSTAKVNITVPHDMAKKK